MIKKQKYSKMAKMKYEDLPDFEQSQQCCKCGVDTVFIPHKGKKGGFKTDFKSDLTFKEFCKYSGNCYRDCQIEKEHIHVVCRCCGYRWVVKCKDATENGE